MSDGDVERVMKLAFCSEEDARKALSETGDVIDAIDSILIIPSTRGNPKLRKVDETQTFFAEMRKDMEAIDKEIESGFKKSGQPDSSSQVSMHIPTLLEEPFQRPCYTQNNHLKLQESEERKQETACQ